MNTEDKKPPSYYKKLTPYEMKDDLLRQVKRRNRVIEHTNKETDFSYLENGNYVVAEIYNPYSQRDFFIEFTDKFKIYYAEWSKEYEANLYDYNILRSKLKFFLQNHYCVYSVFENENILSTELVLYNGVVSHVAPIESLICDILKYLDGEDKNFKISISAWRHCCDFSFVYKNKFIIYKTDDIISLYSGCSELGFCTYVQYDSDTVFITVTDLCYKFSDESVYKILKDIFIEMGYTKMYLHFLFSCEYPGDMQSYNNCLRIGFTEMPPEQTIPLYDFLKKSGDYISNSFKIMEINLQK